MNCHIVVCYLKACHLSIICQFVILISALCILSFHNLVNCHLVACYLEACHLYIIWQKVIYSLSLVSKQFVSRQFVIWQTVMTSPKLPTQPFRSEKKTGHFWEQFFQFFLFFLCWSSSLSRGLFSGLILQIFLHS